MIAQLFSRKSGFIKSISYPHYFINQDKLAGNLDLRVLSCDANVSHPDESPIPQSRGLSLNPRLLHRTGIHICVFRGAGFNGFGSSATILSASVGAAYFQLKMSGLQQ